MRRSTIALVCALGLSISCGEGGTGPAQRGDVEIALAFTGLRPLDPAREGSYQAWVLSSDTTSAGRFVPTRDGLATVVSPIRNPSRLMITVELPGDSDDRPSVHELLAGEFIGGSATLGIVRSVTGVSELETDPGHHALFTPSNNPELSFPSLEDAGLWVFAPVPSSTKHNNSRLKLSPLRAGWIYEGWIVHDYATATECWISYGKFLPDGFRDVNTRDDTGLGPFSGQEDFVNADPSTDMPGDDWVSNIHDLPVPCGLALPFDLNGNAERGVPSRWTHVITIEPRANKGETLLSERPFLMQPYRNPLGQGPPNEGRVIEYHPEFVPTGTATIR